MALFVALSVCFVSLFFSALRMGAHTNQIDSRLSTLRFGAAPAILISKIRSRLDLTRRFLL
ncbi:uncharacterized protein THITE_2107144 [Thermothielavioides terrestris NRRL 8126]|uniref:Uncharacterized protein n=1 Tax=Thermothielavioides terrestris (strain ATCC 38088 / NRRL 8126) TaxID=578455 RepID=G2QSW4_THETT|nr:uncharacterized protein THITE_2107144 [Thermothielavioides terrestris NRRL 8126]AEO62689.1 hypothetical protein THITE_2107144 [Thermothielavioides terrestris NRRL 8126]